MNYRKHGKPPYRIVVVHGGPGAPGEMTYVAKKLSEDSGVIEPFQTSRTISGQVAELHSTINETCDLPVTVVGHSWGVWLSFMLAAEYPDDVGKLILVSAGPFEHGIDVTNIRLSRLKDPDRRELLDIIGLLKGSPDSELNPHTFRRFGELTSKADSFDPMETEKNSFGFQPEIYESVWPIEKTSGTTVRFSSLEKKFVALSSRSTAIMIRIQQWESKSL